jgi:hypothetical protein
MYDGSEGVLSAIAFMDGAPYFGGTSFDIEVEVSEDYPLVTIASMAINTNDCFVAVNGVKVYPGKTLNLDGLDSGSEANNESCESIPGPGCMGKEGAGTNERSGNGEGFVHVHRGMHGVGDLAVEEYDWRNPMMRVKVENV